MTYKIKILSEQMIISIIKGFIDNDINTSNMAFISITSSDCANIDFGNIQNTLKLKFDDITSYIEEKYILFNEDIANEIIKFVDEKIKNKTNYIFINCQAGISRSGAVGTWLCNYLNIDYYEFKEQNKNILPNQHVLRILNNLTIYKKYIIEDEK